MKYATLLLIVLAACTKPAPAKTFQSMIEENFKPKMDDPESFEFVGIDFIDTTSWGEWLEADIKRKERMIAANVGAKDSAVRLIEALDDNSQYGYDNTTVKKEAELDVLNYNNDIDSLRQFIDSLNKEIEKPSSERDYRYSVYCQIRGTNKFGAKVLTPYMVEFTADSLKYIGASIRE